MTNKLYSPEQVARILAAVLLLLDEPDLYFDGCDCVKCARMRELEAAAQ